MFILKKQALTNQTSNYSYAKRNCIQSLFMIAYVFSTLYSDSVNALNASATVIASHNGICRDNRSLFQKVSFIRLIGQPASISERNMYRPFR